MMSNDKTSGNNDGNEDDTRHAFYTSSRYRTTEPLVEDTDKRKHTLRSAGTDSHVLGSCKGRFHHCYLMFYHSTS
jgi:hypothetical protein